MSDKKSGSRQARKSEDAKSPDNSCCGAIESGGLVCPTCGNRITELTSLRCPRCFSSLIQTGGCSGNCSKCGVSKV